MIFLWFFLYCLFLCISHIQRLYIANDTLLSLGERPPNLLLHDILHLLLIEESDAFLNLFTDGKVIVSLVFILLLLLQSRHILHSFFYQLVYLYSACRSELAN